MINDIFVLSGKVSSRRAGESSETPRAFTWKDSAEDAALERFIEWLEEENVIVDDAVILDRLEPEGTFDESSVSEMIDGSNGNIPVASLREYVINKRLCNLFASTDTETYIDLDVNQVEIEE